MSFIQEGRKWGSLEDHLERRSLSQLASIEAFLEYCAGHVSEIRRIVTKERHRLVRLAGREVAVRMDHVTGAGRLSIPVRDLRKDVDTTWNVHPYRGEVKLLESIVLPKQYLIPRKDSSIVSLLRRHHVVVDTVRAARKVNAHGYVVNGVSQIVLEEDSIPSLAVSTRKMSLAIERGDFIIPTGQLQAYLLAVVLEPESYWGLTKYGDFSPLLQEKQYPVLRIP